MRNKIYLLIFCVAFCYSGYAQTLSPDIITSNGGTSLYEDMVIDWTLGEIVTETFKNADRIITQGFQQPVLKITSSVAFEKSPSVVVNVYPNPVNEKLTIAFESKDDSKIIMNVADLFGKKLMMSVSNSQAGNNELDFSAFHAGVYLLTISKPTGEIINTFRITKIQ